MSALASLRGRVSEFNDEISTCRMRFPLRLLAGEASHWEVELVEENFVALLRIAQEFGIGDDLYICGEGWVISEVSQVVRRADPYCGVMSVAIQQTCCDFVGRGAPVINDRRETTRSVARANHTSHGKKKTFDRIRHFIGVLSSAFRNRPASFVRCIVLRMLLFTKK